MLSLIAEQDGGGGRDVLGRMEQGISDVDRVTNRLGEAEGRSQAVVRMIADSVADLTGRLAGVQALRLDIQDIATNTRLLCRLHGTVGRAVSVIAIEVDARADSLGAITNGVAEAIGRLHGIEASLRAADGVGGRDIGEVLGTALTVVRNACRLT